MFSKEFVLDTIERSLYTMAETALGVIGGASMLGQVNWNLVASATLLSGIVTVLKCILMKKKEGKE